MESKYEARGSECVLLTRFHTLNCFENKGVQGAKSPDGGTGGVPQNSPPFIHTLVATSHEKLLSMGARR